MGTRGGRIPCGAMVVFPLVVVPAQGEASELSAGVSFGWVQAGTAQRLAMGPHAGMSWRIERDLLFKVHDQCSVVPPIQVGGAGVYNHTSVAIGYAWESGDVSAGPSAALYLMPACGSTLCGRIAGMAVGGHARINAYLAGPLGVSVSANVDWIGGSSLVLPGHASVIVVAGPVLRWSVK
ncbi:hypothetical protein BE11_07200 [Sorangium cellulosum]|nr:hypothetical protein BE11_07200 [Sorangium cellulosum]